MENRIAYFRECYQRAQHHMGVSIVMVLLSLYSITTTYGPMVAQYAAIERYVAAIPKLPIGWALVIVLLGLLFIAAEGGYRIRGADAEAHHTGVAQIEKDLGNQIMAVRRELANERSVRNAPNLGLELNPDRRIVIVNRSDDRDAHNVVCVRW
jgi:hypothetical protein